MTKEVSGIMEGYDAAMWIKVVEQACEIDNSRVCEEALGCNYEVYSSYRHSDEDDQKCVVFRHTTGEILRYSIANPKERDNWRVFTDTQQDWEAIKWVFSYLQNRFINRKDDD